VLDRKSTILESLWKLNIFRSWISYLGSVIVEVQGSRISPEASRDFALDIIELIKSVDVPIAWHLRHPASRGDRLPCLHRQILQSR